MTALVLLAACIQVDGARLLAGHFAAALAAFEPVPPGEAVGFAPAPGSRRVFSSRELQRLARRYGVEVPGGASVCFERLTEKLTPERVLSAMRAALGRPDARIELLDYTRQPVPRGELEFPRAGLNASQFWRGRVRYDSTRSHPVWARVRLPPREVERGDEVSVEVRSGSARLSFRARAESPGRTGDTVLVKSPIDGRRLAARVEGERKVMIDANNQRPGGRGPDGGGATRR